jgi:hypothetical protein
MFLPYFFFVGDLTELTETLLLFLSSKIIIDACVNIDSEAIPCLIVSSSATSAFAISTPAVSFV